MKNLERERKFQILSDSEEVIRYIKEKTVKTVLIFQMYLPNTEIETRVRMTTDIESGNTTYHVFTKHGDEDYNGTLSRIEEPNEISRDEFNNLTKGISYLKPIMKTRYILSKDIIVDEFDDLEERPVLLLEIEYPDAEARKINGAFLKDFEERFDIKEVTFDEEWKNSNIFNRINLL